MRTLRLTIVIAMLAALAGCDGGGDTSSGADDTLLNSTPAGPKPNIVFIVWDTTRGDRLSLLGYERKTTPYLDEFAQNARVYENCIAVGSTTVPSHVSMFTGLLPAEHGSHNEKPRVPDKLTMLAEILKDAGYRTYAYSENPNVTVSNNFGQGIDLFEHPWSQKYIRKAGNLTLSKMSPRDRQRMINKMRAKKQLSPWAFTSAGSIAQEAVEGWLTEQPAEDPVFIFVNYMEAHRPLLPRRDFRQAFIPPEYIDASYETQPSWPAMWEYVFGLRDIADANIDLIRSVYDASMLELDELTHNLLESLRERGRLDNTIVVVVADHGEALGEHHLLDHQFSVYEQLMRVPIVLYYPQRVKAGRDQRPVMNADLFPTLLELSGLECPPLRKTISLMHAPQKRARLGACPSFLPAAFYAARQGHPTFDPTPWKRSLRAYYDEPYKFIDASDGRHELYDLSQDPGETNNLIESHPSVARRMAAGVQAYVKSLKEVQVDSESERIGSKSAEELQRLAALGYAGGGQEDEPNDARSDKKKEEQEATSQPSSAPSSAPTTQPEPNHVEPNHVEPNHVEPNHVEPNHP